MNFLVGDARELPELCRLIAAGFETDVEVPAAPTLEDVRAFVRMHVERLLDHNPGLLMSILYRIDVAEERVQEVLSTAPQHEIAARLAELIVERELEKVRRRRRHRSD